MLNIDELAGAIRSISPEESAQCLGNLILEWKRDDTTVEDLKSRIERTIGYIWFSTDAVHSEVYRLWSEFRSHAIDDIGGSRKGDRLLFETHLARVGSAVSPSLSASFRIQNSI